MPFIPHPIIGIGMGIGVAGVGGGGGADISRCEQQVNAVSFDGSSDYLTRGAALTGITDTKTGLYSFWYRMVASAPTDIVAAIPRADKLTHRHDLKVANDGNISILGVNASGDAVISAGGVGGLSAGTWAHVLLSFDVSISRLQLYVDDTDIPWTPSTMVNDFIDYTTVDHGIGAGWAAGSPGDSKSEADMAEFWWTHNVSLDLDVEANRRKFVTADLCPVDLGATGSIPTGTDPIIYLSGATASWHTNKGSGDGFTEIGALTDAATSPSD